ncbi:LysM peptidoglycan-binding domain-containing protein [Enterococcus faecium]|nr:LysM peptidoglycan-binding domain-containing protein [Enterococcus faecium]EGP4927263.1 LysM peptidoglycan-binding domain-containing protein [Enterococcus faecium]EGP5054835.1 LysM peptidoglycan-binding domain-containing protein [Enterococcus faecium]EGP5143238.1 LysM peptidoglycan-binding domain-containing protein [Enterococcus faecium]EME3484122.1 LysM peptidoglycan-binding domain-containing protein [Enterococcus faecium]EME5381418.1 LysM peptidoglycan-binding domain-containing protein [E
MGDFLFAVGLIGLFLGIGIFIYSFFSKKKISRKKVIVGIISAFAAMVCGVTISPPDTEQATTHSTIQSTTTSSTTEDTSSESREKEEQKVKEIAKKKKQAQLEAKKKAEEQKAREEAEKKQQEDKRKAEEQKQAEIAQKTSSAETILAQAEANPTIDNYNSALSAIQAIPGGNQSLSNRLANVDSAIKANEAAQTEAAKIAEQARQDVAQAQQQNNQETVLITPTGKKYHRMKCGNGSYNNTTLQEAINRGLTPCEKCYGGEVVNYSEEIAPSSTAASTTTVQVGEGSKEVAQRTGITVDQLFNLNGLDPNNFMLYPGQELRIK